MSTFRQVKPESLIDIANSTPAHGRGAWTSAGIVGDYRYHNRLGVKVGNVAEAGLAYWAVSAGVYAIQKRLMDLDYLNGWMSAYGVFGDPEESAMRDFQVTHLDPQTDAALVVDGTVGRSDARALFTPVIDQYEKKHRIPRRLLLGQTNWESAIDPGAVGYYIFYPEYRGVDRALSQNNSKFNPDVTWQQAFDPDFALNRSAKSMRTRFDDYRKSYPKQNVTVLWDATVAAHNSPLWGGEWARDGMPPNEQIAKYVGSVKNARYGLTD